MHLYFLALNSKNAAQMWLGSIFGCFSQCGVVTKAAKHNAVILFPAEMMLMEIEHQCVKGFIMKDFSLLVQKVKGE